jgi:fibronectin type 3 domain-containing protein
MITTTRSQHSKLVIYSLVLFLMLVGQFGWASARAHAQSKGGESAGEVHITDDAALPPAGDAGRFIVKDNGNASARPVRIPAGPYTPPASSASQYIFKTDSRAIAADAVSPSAPKLPPVNDLSGYARVIYDNFNDNDISQNPTWIADYSGVSVVNGQLHVDGEHIDASDRYLNWIRTVQNFSDDNHLEFAFRGALEGTGSPQRGRGVKIRLVPSTGDTCYDLSIQNGETDGFPINHYSISLGYCANSSLYDLITTDYAPQFDRFYDVRAVRENGMFYLYVDGEMIGSAGDPLFITQFGAPTQAVDIITVGSVILDNVEVRAAGSSTFIGAFPIGERVEVINWDLNANMQLTIDDPGTPQNPDYSASIDTSPENVFGNILNVTTNFDIRSGQIVTVTDGVTTRSLTVADLSITGLNLAADTVSGTGDIGTMVNVYAHPAGGGTVSRFEAPAGPTGSWTADFSTGPDTLNLDSGVNFEINQYDPEGDFTEISWTISHSRFHAQLTGNNIEGYDWPVGHSRITLTIDDPSNGPGVDFTETKFNDDFIVRFDNLGGLTLVPGMIITMTNEITTKVHVVTPLTLGGINPAANTFWGTAAPNSYVTVAIVCDQAECPFRNVVADANGNWSVDFSVPSTNPANGQLVFDVGPGTLGEARQGDDDADHTDIDFYLVNPKFFARANSDQVEASEWPLGSNVTLEIDDPATPDAPDYSATRLVTQGAPWDANITYASFNLGGIFDIQPGFVVSMTDGSTLKTLTVSELSFTDMDVDTETVSGIASPNARVDIWACAPDYCINRYLTADGAGNWTADFGHPGSRNDEQNTMNLTLGTWVDSRERDGDGDETMFGQNIPNPRFFLRANNDQVETRDWPLGSTVTLEIDNPATPANPDYTTSALNEQSTWDPNQGVAYFNLNGVFDIQPGFHASMTDGTTLKTLVVSSLAFTEIELATEIVRGIASPLRRVDIWACPAGAGFCINRHVTADGNGEWVADFGHKGSWGDEQETLDITYGTWIDSQESDNDSDFTMFGQSVPNTRIEAEAWNNRLTGYEFTANTPVTVTVDDPSTPANPDYTETQNTDGNGWVEFWPPQDIVPGFSISMTDGDTTKAMIVSVLHATADEATNTVSGIAGPHANLWFWVEGDDLGGSGGVNVTAEAGGGWNVDLDGLYTLHTWTFGGVNENDADGDITYYRWRVVHPTIEAWLNENNLKIFDWPLGTDLTVTVNDPATPASPDYTAHITTEPVPWFEGAWAYLQIRDGFFLAPGMLVTVSGGGTSDTLTIATIQVTDVNLGADTITGKTDPDTPLDVSLGFDGEMRSVLADGSGDWTADFSSFGDIDGSDVIIRTRDVDWDSTFFEFYANGSLPCLAGGKVVGHVSGLDGAPASGLTVHFDNFDTETSLLAALINTDGWYSCGNLTAGDYRIWADQGAVNNIEYSRQYYNKTIYENATRVTVGAGTHLANVDFVYDTPPSTFMHIDFNMSRPISGELAVRQAIAYGTDRQRINVTVAPGAPVMDSFIPQGAWSHATSGLPEYDYTPTLAASILTTAGWVDSNADGVREKGGARLHLDIYMRDEPRRVQASQIFQENMAAIGMEIEIHVVPNIGLHYYSHDFDLIIFGWLGDENADFGEAGIWWLFKSDHPRNFGLYTSADVDAQLAALLPLRTRAEVLPYATQIQVEVMTDLAILPLFNWATPPTADVEPDQTIPEGSNAILNGNGSSDPYNDITGYAWDTDNDGQFDDAGGGNMLSILFTDNGVYTVGLQVTDAYSMTSTDTAQITVNNVAPTATFNAPSAVLQGGNIALSLTAPVDPSSVDTAAGFQYAFDCGGGGGYGAYGSSNSTNCPTAGASGTRSVGGKIKDKDGGVREYTAQVAIVTPPVNVQAGDGTFTDKVRITWDAVAGATSYKVYRATSAGGARPQIGNPSVTQFTDTTAVTGTIYYYWVRACLGANCTAAYSAYDTGWRNYLPPANLAASDGAYLDKVQVTWDAAGGASYYEVYSATSLGGTKSLLGSPSGTSFDDSAAMPGATYYYFVKACYSVGCTNYSASDTGWRMLLAPTNIQASDGTFKDKVQVTWTAAVGATSYLAYRADTETGAKSLLGGSAASPYDDATAIARITYYYWVKACNGANCSDFSAVDSGWREITYPGNVRASDGTYTDKVQVTWNASSGAASYRVYRATSLTGSKSLLGSPTGTSYDDTGATIGVTYYYWVKTCTATLCSDFSASDTGWRKPLAPTGLAASDGVYTDKVTLSWTGSVGAISYQVYRATSATGTKTGPSTTAATSINDTTATPGVTYWYWVKACRGANCSDFSIYDTGWRNIAPPTNLQASDGTFPDKVQVTWTASLGASSYKLYRATSADGTKTLLGSTTGTTANDTSAVAGTTYYYWVQACRGTVCSDYSAPDTGRR